MKYILSKKMTEKGRHQHHYSLKKGKHFWDYLINVILFNLFKRYIFGNLMS
jgi:hypothetical protein